MGREGTGMDNWAGEDGQESMGRRAWAKHKVERAIIHVGGGRKSDVQTMMEYGPNRHIPRRGVVGTY